VEEYSMKYSKLRIFMWCALVVKLGVVDAPRRTVNNYSTSVITCSLRAEALRCCRHLHLSRILSLVLKPRLLSELA
jgi:hypothetical protein